MIVKQIKFDIEVDNKDIDLEKVVTDLIESNGYVVLGSNQEDLSDYYDYRDKGEIDE
jgi:uncharacterized protein YggL (DUF469 family)